jgi:hypothetical protein
MRRRRSGWFWAVVLILVGVVFLLQNLNIVSNAWALFWPLIIIAMGASLLFGTMGSRRHLDTEDGAVALEGAARADVRVQHGAGRMHVGAGTDPDKLLVGRFGGGLDVRSHLRGDRLDAEIRTPPNWGWGNWGWVHGGALDWDFSLNPDVPLELRFDTGATESTIDLSDTKTTRLDLHTGASSTQLTLPTNAGLTRVRVHLGAASLVLNVPVGVGARIRFEGGLASISVDRARFTKIGGEYRTADYDAAVNKADIDIEAGVGSVQVR